MSNQNPIPPMAGNRKIARPKGRLGHFTPQQRAQFQAPQAPLANSFPPFTFGQQNSASQPFTFGQSPASTPSISFTFGQQQQPPQPAPAPTPAPLTSQQSVDDASMTDASPGRPSTEPPAQSPGKPPIFFFGQTASQVPVPASAQAAATTTPFLQSLQAASSSSAAGFQPTQASAPFKAVDNPFANIFRASTASPSLFVPRSTTPTPSLATVSSAAPLETTSQTLPNPFANLLKQPVSSTSLFAQPISLVPSPSALSAAETDKASLPTITPSNPFANLQRSPASSTPLQSLLGSSFPPRPQDPPQEPAKSTESVPQNSNPPTESTSVEESTVAALKKSSKPSSSAPKIDEKLLRFILDSNYTPPSTFQGERREQSIKTFKYARLRAVFDLGRNQKDKASLLVKKTAEEATFKKLKRLIAKYNSYDDYIARKGSGNKASASTSTPAKTKRKRNTEDVGREQEEGRPHKRNKDNAPRGRKQEEKRTKTHNANNQMQPVVAEETATSGQNPAVEPAPVTQQRPLSQSGYSKIPPASMASHTNPSPANPFANLLRAKAPTLIADTTSLSPVKTAKPPSAAPGSLDSSGPETGASGILTPRESAANQLSPWTGAQKPEFTSTENPSVQEKPSSNPFGATSAKRKIRDDDDAEQQHLNKRAKSPEPTFRIIQPTPVAQPKPLFDLGSSQKPSPFGHGISFLGIQRAETASPASSVGGRSVFDEPRPGKVEMSASNIFGHLASAPGSAQKEDDEDDEEDEPDAEDEPTQAVKVAGDVSVNPLAARISRDPTPSRFDDGIKTSSGPSEASTLFGRGTRDNSPARSGAGTPTSWDRIREQVSSPALGDRLANEENLEVPQPKPSTTSGASTPSLFDRITRDPRGKPVYERPPSKDEQSHRVASSAGSIGETGKNVFGLSTIGHAAPHRASKLSTSFTADTNGANVEAQSEKSKASGSDKSDKPSSDAIGAAANVTEPKSLFNFSATPTMGGKFAFGSGSDNAANSTKAPFVFNFPSNSPAVDKPTMNGDSILKTSTSENSSSNPFGFSTSSNGGISGSPASLKPFVFTPPAGTTAASEKPLTLSTNNGGPGLFSFLNTTKETASPSTTGPLDSSDGRLTPNPRAFEFLKDSSRKGSLTPASSSKPPTTENTEGEEEEVGDEFKQQKQTDLLDIDSLKQGTTVLVEESDVRAQEQVSRPVPDSNDGARKTILETRANGVLLVLDVNDGTKPRLVMKKAPSGDVAINTRLTPMKPTKVGKKSVRMLVHMPKPGNLSNHEHWVFTFPTPEAGERAFQNLRKAAQIVEERNKA